MVQRQVGEEHLGQRRMLRPPLQRPVHHGERGRPASAYTPVTITNPLTSQPLTVYNQSAATRGLVTNLLTTIPT